MSHSTDSEISETEDELINKAHQAVSQSNWVVGECASKWTKKFAKGRTDADFGALVGLSADQVYQRRRVWETFGDVKADYPGLRWSHFYLALTWPDAPEVLQWAAENQTTVAEMRAWRRLQHGEDLTEDDEVEQWDDGSLVSFVPTEPTAVYDPRSEEITAAVSSKDSRSQGDGDPNRATVSSAARDLDGQTEYAPFRSSAGSPPPREQPADVAVAERPKPSPVQLVKRMTTSLERCNKALTPEFTEAFRGVPEKVRNRFVKAVGELSSKVADLM